MCCSLNHLLFLPHRTFFPSLRLTALVVAAILFSLSLCNFRRESIFYFHRKIIHINTMKPNGCVEYSKINPKMKAIADFFFRFFGPFPCEMPTSDIIHRLKIKRNFSMNTFSRRHRRHKRRNYHHRQLYNLYFPP